MTHEGSEVAARPVPAEPATDPAAAVDAVRSLHEAAVGDARTALAAANAAFDAALDRHAPLVELQEFDAEVARARVVLDDARSARPRGGRGDAVGHPDESSDRDRRPW